MMEEEIEQASQLKEADELQAEEAEDTGRPEATERKRLAKKEVMAPRSKLVVEVMMPPRLKEEEAEKKQLKEVVEKRPARPAEAEESCSEEEGVEIKE